MAFGTDDGQTAGIAHFFAELDVRTTSGHVGRYGHGAEQALFFVLCAVSVFDDDFPEGALSGLCHDVGFLLVELGVEHIVRDVA